ncbi:MAG: ATP-binding protein [Gemmatimonadota bacterium]|nr:ATP-binding protein [Gemmatimonadota bacterium]
MDKSYNAALVVLSIVVAITGAYVAIEMAQRVRESRGRRRLAWLACGALSMGLGIWSMHFIAMLALKMEVPVAYDGGVTLLSMLAAVAGCALAFAVFDRATLNPLVIPAASVLMGTAIAGMHYIGMSAMRMPASVHYDSRLVGLSVVVAIVVSFAALIITRRLLGARSFSWESFIRTGAASVLMGMAVVAMHYTGMAATTFFDDGSPVVSAGGFVFHDRNLGVIVAISSLSLLFVALIATQFERWRVEAASRWTGLLELSPQIVWSANAAGAIIDTNRYWYDYTGLAAGRGLGAEWVDVIHPKDRDRVVAAWRKSVETGAEMEIEFRIRRADGAYHSFLSRGRAIRNERGEIVRWVGIAIDIEERKIVETELQENTAELEAQTEELQAATAELMERTKEAQAANQAKSEFLASMSHELRTPLNAIGGYADLLELGLRGPLTPEQTEDIVRIKRSQQHLLRLINDVLNFAKLDAGHVEYTIAKVSVEDTVRDTEPMILPQLETKEIEYHFEDCRQPVYAMADREKLQQILLNVLSNAVKFTEPKGRITLACGAQDARVVVQITDTGIGIPEDKLESIFDPFVQVHQKLNRMSQGVGLGLAISRDLARAMGGELTVESELGKGSTFRLELPRAH